MYFVQILHRHCRSKNHFYVFSYDKTSLKFCTSFRFFLAVFMEKFKKIHYLNYVRRGIDRTSSKTFKLRRVFYPFIEFPCALNIISDIKMS